MTVTSKEAYEFIFGQYGVGDAGIKIWEAAVNWERRECEAIAKRYKQRNNDSVIKRTVADSIINSIKRRDKHDRANGNVR
jgi:cytidylate kinase